MKNILLFVIANVYFSFAYSQIVIKRTDMPSLTDTFRIDATTSIPPINLNDTGANHVWDFSSLFTVYTRTDTFVSPMQTPFYYWPSFNIFNTTLATKVQTPVDFGNIRATDVYNYYNVTNSKFEQVGLAATINGVPLLAKNDANDVIYRFPMYYNDIDSSKSNFEMNIPNVMYIKRDLFRKNIVDGWGKVTTPYGIFDCLRVRSEIDQTDSLYLDTLGQGMKFNRKYVEFKWLTNNEGIPIANIQALITISGQLQVQFVEFKNKNTVACEPLFDSHVQVAPQPASESVSIRAWIDAPETLQMQWFDMQGKLISSAELESNVGMNEWHLSKPQSGLCFLKISGKNGVWSQKIVWE